MNTHISLSTGANTKTNGRLSRLWKATFLLSITLLGISWIHGQQPTEVNSQIPPEKRSEIETATMEYFEAVAAKDIDRVKALLNPASPQYQQHIKSLEGLFNYAPSIELREVNLRALEAGENSFAVRAIVDAYFTDPKSGEERGVFDTRARNLFFSVNSDVLVLDRHVSYEAEIADKAAELGSDSQVNELIEASVDADQEALIVKLYQKGASILFATPPKAVLVLRAAERRSINTGIDSHLKSIFPNLGMAYDRVGEYRLSLDYFERSLRIFRELGDENFETRVYQSMARTYLGLRDYRKAIELIEKRIAYVERTGDKSELLTTLINISGAHGSLGDNYKALDAQSRALDILSELATKDAEILKSPRAASLIGSIGYTYERLGNLELALDYYRRSLDVNASIKRNDPGLRQNIGNVLAARGDFQGALEQYEIALRYFAESSNKPGYAGALQGIGNMYSEEGVWDLALEYHTKALEAYEEIDRAGDGQRTNVAIDLFRLGRVDESLTIAESVANRTKRDGKDFGYIPASLLLSEIYREKKDEPARERSIDNAISIVEKVFSPVSITDTLAFGRYTVSNSAHYEMAKLRIEQGRQEEAFRFIEMAKAKGLLSLLVNGKIDVYGAMSAEERQTEKAIKEDLISIPAQIEAASKTPGSDGERVKELEDRLAQTREKFVAFQAKMFGNYPSLAAQRARTEPIDPDEVKNLIADGGTAVIEMAVLQDRLLLIAISSDPAGKPQFSSAEVRVSRKDLAERVEAFRTALASGQVDFGDESRGIYDLILKPVERWITGRKNLVIVPDGPLWDLPFQALRDERGRFLIETAAVSYAPSLTALREMSKRSRPRKLAGEAELLAFGNPIIEDRTKESLRRVLMSGSLEPLPEAERLVNELGKMYGPSKSKVLVGAEAREDVAKKEAPNFRIVQFATHGILNNGSPMYSQLVLARDEKNPNEDGLLEAWELKDLDLKADIVILSACETARGRIANGEGIVGMTWASFIAGAPTTVASQWKVESSSTTELMLEFHRQLRTGKVSKAEALRRASLKVMKMPKYRHPSYWAGFVLVGDGN